MSGIVGILDLDGAPVDRTLLTRMTDFMAFRGPDDRRIWVDGNIGFGHTLLRTTEESEHEEQPLTLDGRVWIVADARVDAQADLIAKLEARGECVGRGITDVELLLRAYRTWGKACVEYLLGDFSFAVWDGLKHELFCARDHLGVKQFFYSQIGRTLIFSNTLDCIRQHPGVSNKLNELAIADFLLFDVNQDSHTTSFVDIHRIPPAHRATWSVSGNRKDRYWTMPIDEPIFFKRADEYAGRFTELLDLAISDRLRTRKIALFMSGGLDSPALAARASKLLRKGSSDYEIRAFTTVVEGLDQNEKHYASLVAEQLAIPIHFRDCSAKSVDPDWETNRIHTPEPILEPRSLVADRAEYEQIAKHSRVLFYGEGPDNALRYEWKPYTKYLLRKRKFGCLLADICKQMIRHRRVPLLPTIPRMLKQGRPRELPFPNWFASSFASRAALRERWERQEIPTGPTHPVRPAAYRSLNTPLWEALFRRFDADETTMPIETRHPFVDLRMLRYMLAVPAIPWCRAKYIERRAMSGTLPTAVLKRPKTPVKGDSAWEAARRLGLRRSIPAPGINEYVDFERIPKEAGPDIMMFQVNFRPVALNYWLQNISG